MLLKHIILVGALLLIIILSYFIIKKFLNNFHKLYLKKDVIKYPLVEYDINFLKNKSNSIDIDLLLKLKRFLFYTEHPWNSKNNNYIPDKVIDKYYIIDKGYYYYINNVDSRYNIVINKDIVIKLFDFSKYYNKIIFL